MYSFIYLCVHIHIYTYMNMCVCVCVCSALSTRTDAASRFLRDRPSAARRATRARRLCVCLFVCLCMCVCVCVCVCRVNPLTQFVFAGLLQHGGLRAHGGARSQLPLPAGLRHGARARGTDLSRAAARRRVQRADHQLHKAGRALRGRVARAHGGGLGRRRAIRAWRAV